MVRIERCNPEYSAHGTVHRLGVKASAVGFVSRFSVVSVRAVLSFIFAPQALTTFRSPAAAAFFSAPTFSLAAHNVISDVFFSI